MPAGTWLAEVVATAGLLLLIFALVRTGRAALAPPAVGAYIGAAYWFTSSTSFANPAVTIGRAFTDTFAGIAPASVPGFVVAQLVGLVVGLGAIALFYPGAGETPTTSSCRTRAPPARAPADVEAPDAPATCPDEHHLATHRASRPAASPASCSSASTTRAAPRWPPGASATSPATGRGPLRRLRPGDQVNPAAVEAMAEVGIDITAADPKILTTDAVQASDVVITMGCGDACPIFPGKRYLDWELDDPAGKGVEAVRPIRDEIKTRIEQLIAELTPAT